MTSTTRTSPAPQRLWRPASLLLLATPWLVLQLGGLFSPGLLDDVDSVYTEIAREMLARHDFVTPYVDGVRFFDKPPLMYWMAAGSMRLFGPHDWAARLPLALGVLALLLSVYALGVRLFAAVSPAHAPDRGGLYAALATGVSIGPYLYTRFYIPDILIALWMTLSVHLLLIALDRIDEQRSTLWPSLGFAAVAALNVLTKGLIGLVFPLGFVLLYLLWNRRLDALRHLHLALSTLVFLAIAAPWHILAALRNPPIPMPGGVGLPARAGWTWFYLYNEHIARFLQKRIPHDYGQVPVPLFWLLLFLWLIPWTGFVFPAMGNAVRVLRSRSDSLRRFDSDVTWSPGHLAAPDRENEAARALPLWAGLILGFFTLSSRQEYYHLPALPALALLTGGLLAAADASASRGGEQGTTPRDPLRQALTASRWFLVPLGTLLFTLCGYFALTAPRPAPGATLNDLLSSNPDLYTLSLGHVFDLTGRAMGLFRGPLITVALGMLLLGPGSHLLRRRNRTYAANLLLAAAMTVVLLGAHEALVRFYPILGSKQLAESIEGQRQPGDLVAIDGELTSGSTLLFYGHPPVYLVNGRVNGPWFGSFWPDAPHLFWDDGELAQQWAGPHRVFLLTYHPDQRIPQLARLAPTHAIAASGGKTILINR
ncbi:MAG TPA: glycosyltransferase family 39 protein [Acidobacteriaceae bacterium]|nr:glycosyltransferase family 39 protein [Acidobacteriaceae bacterium]